MREKDIEKYLRDQVKKECGIAYKFESPGNSGVPDRLVLLPGKKIVFVELKAPGKKPSPIQLAQHRKITKLGFEVFVIDSKEGVDKFINWHVWGR
ncbi:VRR-NUC domain-containing protein [Bacillus sp. CRN 9]|nr:VRR-NUC domain-containing protein [Bacillus sp. CRN 9]